MSKRRVFDIDFPDEPDPAAPSGSVPAGTQEGRRGPMAAAIVENADALAERTAAEAAIRAENDQLAHEHVRLKKQGLITDLVPVDLIDMSKLVRDRRADGDTDLEELKASIRAVGLSNPIRVEQAEQGRFELVQGFRRLTAFLELLAETGDEFYSRIPAGFVPRDAGLDGLYRRMVDENLVRRDISFGEMAMLVLNYIEAHPGQGDDPLDVSDRLYASASRQKRGHIRSFVRLMMVIGGALRFPEAVPRALGTDVLRRLDDDPDLAKELVAALKLLPESARAEDELKVLREAVSFRPSAGAAPRRSQAQARTSLKLVRKEGTARCTAVDGKVELRLERDFSSIDRSRLEAAVAAFLDTLDSKK